MAGDGVSRVVEAAALLLVGGAAGAAAAAWRAARRARRAAEASADQLRALHEGVRRAVHDLNNPLAAAAINAELLRHACPDNETACRLSEKIQDQIQRAKDAAGNLSQLAKPSA